MSNIVEEIARGLKGGDDPFTANKNDIFEPIYTATEQTPQTPIPGLIKVMKFEMADKKELLWLPDHKDAVVN